MSRPSALQAILYNTEATFGEDQTSFGTRLPTVGRVDVAALKQASVDPMRTVQYRNQLTPQMNGIMGGSFKTKFWLTGHGSTAAGALVLNSLETLLGIVFGNSAAASSGGTTATGGSTASSLNVALASGYAAGSLLRCGALNDARGNGQFAALSSHAASVIALLTAIDAAPNAADVIYNPCMIYGSESPSSVAITGTRWLLQTANLQFECHGCYPKTVTFAGLNTGETPSIEIEWGVAWWRLSTATFPNATAVTTFAAAPVASGSFFLNTQGTTTRAKRTIRKFTLNFTLGIVELKAPGGVNAYQAVLGCTRIPDKISIEWTEDSEAATTSPTLAGYWDGNAVYHALYTLSAADGTALGFYFPYLVPAGDRPSQEDQDGLNRVKIKFLAGTGGTNTTDLTGSAMRLASA